MKSPVTTLSFTLLLTALASAPAWAGYIARSEVKEQNEHFQQWWETKLEWKAEKLPVKGRVPSYRMPYAGYIYPDKAGGCINVLGKYDRAFNWGRGSAAAYERHDIAIHKDTVTRRGGLFGWRMVTRRDTPDWAGHCNGWTAAAIRHAEPRRSVIRNGVRFTPADIKALLAELYVYNDNIYLGGANSPTVNPGTLHVILANWVGLGEHPIGMDATVGKEVWNYPIYGFSSTVAKRGERRLEVRTNVGYVYMLEQPHHRAPRNNKYLALHYMLYLDEDGRIIGGDYLSGSHRVDMLWTPRRLFPGGSKGNEKGNPYVDTKTVLAMWRESAPEEIRKKWWNIDPTEEDRIIEVQDAPAADELADESSASETADGEPSESDNSPSESSDGESSASDADDAEVTATDDAVVEGTFDLPPDIEAEDSTVSDEAREPAADTGETTGQLPAEDAAPLDEEDAALFDDANAEDADAPATHGRGLSRRHIIWRR